MSQYIHQVFNTTTLRLAEVFDALDLGKTVQDLENGQFYMVISSGAGAASMSRVGGSQQGSLNFSLNDFREVDASGDVSNIAANGGLLASDTTPILRGDAAESAEISWATGNADIVAATTAVHADFDGTRDVTLQLVVKSGTTDAATIAVETSWDGGTLVVDSASDSATKSATAHTITATIAHADIPDAAARVTLILTPPAHATNAIELMNVRMLYWRK